TAALRQAFGTGAARLLATWAAGAGLMGVIIAGLAAHRADRLSGIMLTVLVCLAALDQGALLPAALAGRAMGNAAAARLGELAGLEPPVREPLVDASPSLGAVAAV